MASTPAQLAGTVLRSVGVMHERASRSRPATRAGTRPVPRSSGASPGTSTGPRPTRAPAATCASACTRTSVCPGGGSRSSAPTARGARRRPRRSRVPTGTRRIPQLRAARASRRAEPLHAFRVVEHGAGVELADPAEAFHGRATAPGRAVPVALDLEWASAVRGVPVRDDDPLRDLVVGHRHGHDRRRDGRGRLRRPARPLVGGARLVAVPVELDRPATSTTASFFHAARSIIPDLELFAHRLHDRARRRARTGRVDDITVDVDIDAEKLPTAARQRIGPRRVHHRDRRPRAGAARRARRSRGAVPPGDVPLHHRRRPHRHRLDRVQLAAGLPAP